MDQDRQQFLFKYESSYVRVPPTFQIISRTYKCDNKVSVTRTPNNNIQDQPKDRYSRNFNGNGDEIDMLSNSMEQLSMFQPIETPLKLTEKRDMQLKKNMKVCFISKTKTSGTMQYYCHYKKNPLESTVKYETANFQADQ